MKDKPYKSKRAWHCQQVISYLIFILIIALFVLPGETPAEDLQRPSAKYKILHIMSYHSPWKWTDDQLIGFKYALRDLDIEYRVLQMDTKRQSSAEWKEKIGQEARELVKTWQPDLVYTNDDNAQIHVARHFINNSIPFVFSGVNADPAQYGFDKSDNITGVIEQEHFVASVKLLRSIVPDIKKIAVIIDEDPTWEGVTRRMKGKLDQIPEVQISSWDTITTFEQYKKRVNELQREADAIAMLGIFTFQDAAGKNVSYQEVLKWTAENSKLPDFSFWEDRVYYGTLCAVTVSGYEQGLAAGMIARGILADGRKPSSYQMTTTLRGEPVINLRRAKDLGISIDTDLLLNVRIIKEYSWSN